ncbi:AbrB/MazE/SpoVT family DNA-binding domain-containing protein [Candidatus Woesearchaeota archaeon]|nr:AbrB/MazE/SpoVT family DNA-binding domain-containing protein [Candidatus Woesearchaeota archaeon]
MAVDVKTKQWGNSIGVIIPKQVVDALQIKQGDDLMITIEKKNNVLKDLWGSLSFGGKSSKQLVLESRKELESKWDTHEEMP